MTAKPHDRRQQRRQTLELLISYEQNKKHVTNFSYDLSSGGIFIETTQPFPDGTAVPITFELPHDRSRFTLTATVTWSRRGTLAQPAGMGLRFELTDGEPTANLLIKALSYYEKLNKKSS